MRHWLLLTTLSITAACAPATAPSEAPVPTPEDPAYTITLDRPIQDVHRRTVGFRDAGVWFSNEFPGGRLNDVWRDGDTLFVGLIRPENAPINNSAWFAFKVWSDGPESVVLRLEYDDGRHRYWPKTRLAGRVWQPLAPEAVRVDTITNTATFLLDVGPDTLWVAGQKLITSAELWSWTDSLATLSHVSSEVIGRSRRGRDIHMLTITDNPRATEQVLLIGRQHPPEVTVTLGMIRFVEEIAGDTPLARRFRQHFQVRAVPLVNPDGVDLGHWRHNTGGVDLNRDWVAFRQPETRAVRDAFLRIREQGLGRVWFAADFHSTWRDVFYTLDRELETEPASFIDRWLDRIDRELPDYHVDDSPSGLASPTSRNWFYREFGAPAVTYEVGDGTDPDLIRAVAATAARAMMELLLDSTDLAERVSTY